MPSPIAHTLAAYSALITLDPTLISNRERNSLALGAGFVFGSLADADFVVAHFATQPYLRHHYFSHSIPFALVFTALCWLLLRMARRPSSGRWAGLFGAAYFTHLVLDYLTEDGSYPYGIPLLWPFSNSHFMTPVRIFYSIHRGMWEDIFSPENLQAIVMEVAIMAPVTLIAILVARRRLAGRKRGPVNASIPAR